MWAALTGNLWRAGAIALAGICLGLLVQIHGVPVLGGGLIAERDAAIAATVIARRERDAERAAHQATKDQYQEAQAQAARDETLRLARVKGEQERISTDVAENYARRLADYRARYEQLRRQAAAAAGTAGGSAGGEPVPGVRDAAPGADAPACADGLSLDQRWDATRQALQLDELISWIERQARVPANDPTPKEN